jgi:hypothetical protein
MLTHVAANATCKAMPNSAAGGSGTNQEPARADCALRGLRTADCRLRTAECGEQAPGACPHLSQLSAFVSSWGLTSVNCANAI